MRKNLMILFLLPLSLYAIDSLAAGTVVDTRSGAIVVESITANLQHPWGMAFLPGGRMLVTERPGRLLSIAADGTSPTQISGVPPVYAVGQGGLLDVALDPAFAQNRLIYLSYARPGPNGTAGTAVMRARLKGNRLVQKRILFEQHPKVSGPNHFGSRLVFASDGTLLVTLAERFTFARAQSLRNHLGKIVRINTDGSVPADNPFVNRRDKLPEIWSYGHRNVQGAALHPVTGALWISEFGPRGGDEINISRKGLNFGWPLVSWGVHYNGDTIPLPPTRPDLRDALHHWTPSISPSGMTFYTGDQLPLWRGNLLVGALSERALVRVVLQGNKVVDEEHIELQKRIRHVRQGHDGAVYLLTDEDQGEILRLTPKR